jgi:hypothetical protein
MYAKFNEWYDRFIGDIRNIIYENLEEFKKNNPFAESAGHFSKIMEKWEKEINGQIPADNHEIMRKNIELGAGSDSTASMEYYMDIIYRNLSSLADELAGVCADFAPKIQKILVEILEQSGLEKLLEGNTPREKLECFISNFQGKNILTEMVDRILKLNEQLAYILRFQMRPAVNFANKYQWNYSGENSHIPAFKELAESLGSEFENKIKCISEFKQKRTIKDLKNNNQELLKIAEVSLKGIEIIIGAKFREAARMADDILQLFQMELSVKPVEGELRNDLLPLKDKILKADAEIAKNIEMKKIIDLWHRYFREIKKAA